MNAQTAQLNLLFAWLWLSLGFLSGMILGWFFHRENWLGGYGSFKCRMYRLGHISFFGLGAVNLLFWLTMQRISPAGPLADVASCAFLIGGISMPLCCGIMANFPKAHLIFTVPVVSLIAGGALTLALLSQTSVAPVTPHEPKRNVSVKKPALTPALSPEERETLFPRVDNVAAMDWRGFRGQYANGSGKSLPGETSPVFETQAIHPTTP
jgi:hypothetical protein